MASAKASLSRAYRRLEQRNLISRVQGRWVLGGNSGNRFQDGDGWVRAFLLLTDLISKEKPNVYGNFPLHFEGLQKELRETQSEKKREQL